MEQVNAKEFSVDERKETEIRYLDVQQDEWIIITDEAKVKRLYQINGK